jgi:hypothetical protein
MSHERLRMELAGAEAMLSDLRAELAHMIRKNDHKCIDAYCEECDGPRPETRKRGKR